MEGIRGGRSAGSNTVSDGGLRAPVALGKALRLRIIGHVPPARPGRVRLGKRRIEHEEIFEVHNVCRTVCWHVGHSPRAEGSRSERIHRWHDPGYQWKAVVWPGRRVR